MSAVNQEILVDLPSICLNFPKPPKNEIRRDNFISTIESFFKGDSNIIFIEGEEGVGKTNILSQFARKHSKKNNFHIY